MIFDAETRRAGRIIGAIIAVIVTGILSWEEVRFMTSAAKVDASLVSARLEQDKGRFSSRTIYRVEYLFTDESDGSRRRESFKMPEDWAPPAAGADGNTIIPVEYIPGSKDQSRLSGERRYVAPILFALAIVVASLWGWQTWRELKY